MFMEKSFERGVGRRGGQPPNQPQNQLENGLNGFIEAKRYSYSISPVDLLFLRSDAQFSR